MIVYNITYMISHQVHDEWLTWMKETHMPEMMSTGLFERNQMLRILEVDETEGLSFAVQFFVSNLDNYNSYITNHATALRLKGTQKWSNQVLGFRTLMEIVQ